MVVVETEGGVLLGPLLMNHLECCRRCWALGLEHPQIAIKQPGRNLDGGALGELLGALTGANLFRLAATGVVDEKPPTAVVALPHLNTHSQALLFLRFGS
jgi:hypothetical protein